MAIELSIPARTIKKYLLMIVPLVEEIFGHFKEKSGPDSLTPKLRRLIAYHEIDSWAEIYEIDSDSLKAFAAELVIQKKTPSLLSKMLAQIEIKEQQIYLDSMWEHLEKLIDLDVEEDFFFSDGKENAEPLIFSDMGSDEEPLTRQSVALCVMLPIVYNYFSCMVYRKTIFQLVQEAKQGDDEAFFKAAHIDRTCLKDIEYFQERQQRAFQESDAEFLMRLMRLRQKPPLQSGIQLNSLYFIFSVLDAIGVLDACARRGVWFAELCQEVGAYGPYNDVVDVESFARALRRFKAEHQSPTQFDEHKIMWVVKDKD